MHRYPWLQIDDTSRVCEGLKVKQGRKSFIGWGSFVFGKIKFGEGVMIGPKVIITSSSHGVAKGKYMKDQEIRPKTVTIGDDVWVCAGAIILGGCNIGSGAVIGAGSVLLEDSVVGENEIWAGNPCKFIKHREPEDGDVSI